MARRMIFTGTFAHTPTANNLEVLENAAVFVDEFGVITHIDVDASSPEARIRNDLEGWSGAEVVFTRPAGHEFFFPGFVDTHIHASQYPNAGIFGNSSLLDWLEKYTFPLEASLQENLNMAQKVYGRCIARTLANGTTTAAYYATRGVDSTNTLADLCLKAGQRAFVGRCCMDANAPNYYCDADPESAIRDTEATVAHCNSIDPHHRIVCPIITPRFAPSCSSALLKALGELAQKEGLPVQTHIAESKAEVEWVQKLFPESKSYADVYDSHGLLGERTILAHAIHLTGEEIELIRARGSGVSHCPVSNLSLTSGCAKVKALMKKGIKVGLGTDMSGGYSPSVLESVRQATLVSRIVALADNDENAKLSVAEALYLGTVGGAEVVGLGDKVGAFKVGMQWDAMLVGLGGVPEDLVDGDTGKSGSDEGLEDIKMEDETKTETDSDDEEAKLGIDREVGDNQVDIFGWENWHEQVAKWVYNGDDRNTLSVWVAGVEVYRKGGLPPTWPLDLTA